MLLKSDFKTNEILIIAILCLIALDVFTGIVKAITQENFKSKEMRTGLLRKSGTIMLVGLAYGLQYLCGIVPELPQSLSLVFDGVSLYIIIMEITSNIENILIINPELKADKIRQFFGLSEGGSDE